MDELERIRLFWEKVTHRRVLALHTPRVCPSLGKVLHPPEKVSSGTVGVGIQWTNSGSHFSLWTGELVRLLLAGVSTEWGRWKANSEIKNRWDIQREHGSIMEHLVSQWCQGWHCHQFLQSHQKWLRSVFSSWGNQVTGRWSHVTGATRFTWQHDGT